MDNLETIPVGGVKDWMKSQLKNFLLSYAKPYWNDIVTAIQNKDYVKLADVIAKLAELAGYAAVGTSIADVLKALAAGDYLTAAEKAIVAIRTILALFPAPAPKPADQGGVITVSASADPVGSEIHEFVDAVFDAVPAMKLTVEANDVPLDADGKPVKFGVIEFAAIFSIAYTAWQWVRQRRQQNQAG